MDGEGEGYFEQVGVVGGVQVDVGAGGVARLLWGGLVREGVERSGVGYTIVGGNR